MANKSKVLTGKNYKEAQKNREVKGDRRPSKNKNYVDEIFSYKKGTVFNQRHYIIFENDITGDDVKISEKNFKEWTEKITAKEIKITAKSDPKGNLIQIKKIEIIK